MFFFGIFCLFLNVWLISFFCSLGRRGDENGFYNKGGVFVEDILKRDFL